MVGVGRFSLSVRCVSSFTTISDTVASVAAHCVPEVLIHSRLVLTASALNGVPSWKTTPDCRVRLSSVGVSSQDFARCGSSENPSGATFSNPS